MSSPTTSSRRPPRPTGPLLDASAIVPSTAAPTTAVVTSAAATTAAAAAAATAATTAAVFAVPAGAAIYTENNGCCRSDIDNYAGDRETYAIASDGDTGKCKRMCTAELKCMAFELKTNKWKGGVTLGYTCDLMYHAQTGVRAGRSCKNYMCGAKIGNPTARKAQHKGKAAGRAAGSGAGAGSTNVVVPVAAAAGCLVVASILLAAYLRSSISQSRHQHGATTADSVDGMTWDDQDMTVLGTIGFGAVARRTEV